MDNLTQEILNIINETIEGQYIGRIEVIHDDDEYILKMFLNRNMTPLILSFQGSECGFKEFVRSEIKHRKLESISYWEITREISSDDDEQDIESW